MSFQRALHSCSLNLMLVLTMFCRCHLQQCLSWFDTC